MRTTKMDYKALEQAVLKELQRQGVEFARVKMYLKFGGSEDHLIIEEMTEGQIQPKYVEMMRVSNQVAESAIPNLKDETPESLDIELDIDTFFPTRDLTPDERAEIERHNDLQSNPFFRAHRNARLRKYYDAHPGPVDPNADEYKAIMNGEGENNNA